MTTVGPVREVDPTLRPVVGVLALQGDVREHLRMLETAGATARQVRRPADLAAVDALVLPGGESTTVHKLLQRVGLLDPLRERIRAGLPAFGTCAGLVLLADRLENPAPGQETVGGLDVVVRRNAFGRQVDSFEADLAVAAPGGRWRSPFHALFIRAPWVEKVGDGVQVLARVAGEGGDQPEPAGRIVAVRQANLLATSFHPEITGDHRMHAMFVDLVRAAVGGR
jgi:5'-phosphate synthase pdxT subunit